MPRRGLTQFASLLSYLNWAGRVGASWCSPSVGPGFTTILAPSNGVRALCRVEQQRLDYCPSPNSETLDLTLARSPSLNVNLKDDIAMILAATTV